MRPSQNDSSVLYSPDCDFSFYGVGDEALLVCEVMQLIFVGRRRKFLAAINNLGIERDGTDPRRALFILGHHPDGFVFVTVHLKTLPRSDEKKREHVTA